MAVLKSPKNNHKRKISWIKTRIRKTNYLGSGSNKYVLNSNNPLYTSTWRSRKNRVNKITNLLSKKILYPTLLS